MHFDYHAVVTIIHNRISQSFDLSIRGRQTALLSTMHRAPRHF